jgi:hypothetical protein
VSLESMCIVPRDSTGSAQVLNAPCSGAPAAFPQSTFCKAVLAVQNAQMFSATSQRQHSSKHHTRCILPPLAHTPLMHSATFCGLGNRVLSGGRSCREVRLLQVAAWSTAGLDVLRHCSSSPPGRAAALDSATASAMLSAADESARLPVNPPSTVRDRSRAAWRASHWQRPGLAAAPGTATLSRLVPAQLVATALDGAQQAAECLQGELGVAQHDGQHSNEQLCCCFCCCRRSL